MNCVICEKKAKYRYSPDLDIIGLGACERCNVNVHILYMVLVSSGKEMYNDLLKGFKKDVGTIKKATVGKKERGIKHQEIKTHS